MVLWGECPQSGRISSCTTQYCVHGSLRQFWFLLQMSLECENGSHQKLVSSSPPALNLSQHQGLFQWVSSSHQVARVSEFQHQSFQWIFRTDLLSDWLVGSPCSLRDSQESSPTPQFKSIDSSVLSFLYGPTLTSIHDHWKNHSFDQTDLCWQSNISAF